MPVSSTLNGFLLTNLCQYFGMLPVLSSHAECSLHWAVQEVRLETKVSLFQHVQFGGGKQKPRGSRQTLHVVGQRRDRP